MTKIEDVEKLLQDAFRSKNYYEFKLSLMKLKNCFGSLHDHLNNSEIFYKILWTPKSGKFIEQCLEAGASFYKKTSSGKFPLEIAFESRCLENISTLLQSSNSDTSDVKFNEILNIKFKSRNSFLHLLAGEVSKENFDLTSDLMEILVKFGCKPSSKNEDGFTAKDIIAMQQIANDVKKKIAEILKSSKEVTIETDKSSSIFTSMKMLLSDEREKEFEKNFASFKRDSEDYENEALALLEIAIVKNFVSVAKLIISTGVNLNLVTVHSVFGKEPAFLAANLGRKEIFAYILCKNLNFQSERSGNNLLHEILSAKHFELAEILEMFSLVINNFRCTIEIINGEDKDSKSPLYYACVNRYDSIATQLLRKGAYIGSKNVLDVIELNLVRKFLDECLIKMNDDDQIMIDFQFMVPAAKSEVAKSEALKNIAGNSKFEEVLKHPVLTTFLDLKWNFFKWFYALKSLTHLLLLSFIVFTLAVFLNEPLSYSGPVEIFISIAFPSILLALTIIEIYQIYTSYRTYFFKLGNWLDLMTLGTILYISFSNIIKSFIGDEKALNSLIEELHISSAFLILLVSAQALRIFGFSIYTTMFRKVSISFLKLLILYFFLFVTFALSFHILYKADVKNNFVTNELRESAEEISSRFEFLPNDTRSAISNALNLTENHKTFLIFLKNNEKAKKFLEQKGIQIESHLKEKYLGENDTRPILLSLEYLEKFDDVSERLNDDKFRADFFKELNWFSYVTTNVSLIIRDSHKALLKIADVFDKSDFLKPGSTCEIDFNDTETFFDTIAGLKGLKTLKTLSLCPVKKRSRDEFVEKVLHNGEELLADPFVLCGKSTIELDDLFKTIVPIKLKENASFKTFCDLSESSQNEFSKSIFKWKMQTLNKVKSFCSSKNKTVKNTLQAFYDLNDFDFLSQEKICSNNKNIADQYLNKIMESFNLNDPHHKKLLNFCRLENYIIEIATLSPFASKFTDKSELKELCFVDENLRKEVLEKNLIEIRSEKGIVENFSVEKLDEHCKSDIIKLGDESLESYEDPTFEDFLTSGSICDMPKKLSVDEILQLFDLEKADILELIKMCENDEDDVENWFALESDDEEIEFSYTDLCELPTELREVFFEANSLTVKTEIFSFLCELEEEDDSSYEDFTDDSKEDSMFNDETRDTHLVSRLLSDDFEIHDVCGLKSESRTEILKIIFDRKTCINRQNSNSDNSLDNALAVNKNIRRKHNFRIFGSAGDTQEKISLSENLCRISSKARFNFLHRVYGFTNSSINFIDKVCKKFNVLKPTLETISNIEKNFKMEVSIICQFSEKHRRQIFPEDEQNIEKLCGKSEADRKSLISLIKKLSSSKDIKLKTENMCQIHETSRTLFVIDDWDQSEIDDLNKACFEARQRFLSESSGYVFNSSFSFADAGHICTLSKDNRRKFLETFTNLNDEKINQLLKMCEILPPHENATITEAFKSVLTPEDLTALKPENLCSLTTEGREKVLNKTTGAVEHDIEVIEILCKNDYVFSSYLERYVFVNNFIENLKSQNFCKLYYSLDEVDDLFLENLSDKSWSEICAYKKFSSKQILQDFFKLSESYAFKPSNLCKISKTSRDEIIVTILKINSKEAFNQMDKLCRTEQSHQEKLFAIPSSSIALTLKKTCNDSFFWRDVADHVFGHKDCSFLKVKKVCQNVVLNFEALRKDEVKKIDISLKKLKEGYENVMIQRKKIENSYWEIFKSKEKYEYKIEGFANFRTFQISVFRSFTMFAGEFGSENSPSRCEWLCWCFSSCSCRSRCKI